MTRPTARLIPIFVFAAVAACSSETGKTADTAAAIADTGALAPPPAETGSATATLDPNSASRTELASVPGLSDTVAGAIIAARPIASMTALDRLLPRNLTEPQRDSVYARVWKPINLNTATDQEILLIPGVGPRMLHEFKEYRPYSSIEQFRREIGKYVDKAELARLELYVAKP